MKPCRKCGKQVSESAEACPNCGEPHPANTLAMVGESLQSIGCLLTLIITMPILLFMFC